MKFLNSLLETLKKFWYFFAILALTALVLVVGFVENSKLAGLTNSIKDIITSYKKQVKTMDKLGDKKAASDKETVQTYIDREKEIQTQRDAELAKIKDASQRSKILNELTVNLDKTKKSVMMDLLEGVQTSQLKTAFDKYLPAVLNETVQNKKAVLSEGKREVREATGDRVVKTNTDSRSVVKLDELKKLAGIQ